ncbi:MAG: asparagine--tRNA ligase [Candidatus Pacearchaeota archaeon]|nr:MAG: asparagine--tRNA ligase [Candidatus Pacearchaeota archaeon]
MRFISVQQALDKKRGTVDLRGWVYQLRKLKDKIFIVLRDSSNIIQCIIEEKSKTWKDANKLTIESSIEISGILRQDKRAPTGYELLISRLNIIHIAEKYPIPVRKQYLSPELLLDWRHLWLRDPKMQSSLKVRSTVFRAIHEYCRSKGFYEFQSPILTSGAAEAGPSQFKVDFFGKPLYLTQTWQFYAEAGMFSLEKLYTIAPSFRAERSKTSRHLAEYWHAEVEAAWFNLDNLIDFSEGLVKHIIKRVLEKNKHELEVLKRDTKSLQTAIKKKWPRITYDQALKLLKEKKKMKISWGKDLRTIEEDRLTELFDTPVFVTHYPKEIMAFYKPRDKKNPKTARCFDLLAPEGYGELIGGSERDTNIKELIKSLKAAGEKVENYKFYLDTRRYGSIPHSGFGLGVERVISWLCKLEHIRDAIPFPRTMARYKP